MSERFAIYRYPPDPDGPDSAPRYSFAPIEGVGAAGRASHADASRDGSEENAPLGHLEAPAGSHIVEVEPPVLEVPGQGRVDIASVIGVTEGNASANNLLRWHKAR